MVVDFQSFAEHVLFPPFSGSRVGRFSYYQYEIMTLDMLQRGYLVRGDVAHIVLVPVKIKCMHK